ncbi:MAG: TIGR02117 family protein [Aureisphaera sp.]
MRLLKKILKFLGFIIAIPICYVLISLLLSAITVNKENPEVARNTGSIFLSTNGVHLDIVIPRESMDEALLKDLVFLEDEKYLAFGWGDENFYLHTPTWGDLTFGTAIKAMFLESPTLMHITRHRYRRAHWVEVAIDSNKMKELNKFILASFNLDANGNKIELPGTGYSDNDNFYRAIGSYSFIKTCNSWANSGFKESGLKASYWTPFDFGLLNKYE